MIDRAKFFQEIRVDLFHGSMSQQQVSTIDGMLDYWAEHFTAAPIAWLAYTFATAYHETARTFGPIAEIGGKSKRYAPYYGRGLVQLTWDYNYRNMGRIVGEPLFEEPERALAVPTAIKIIFEGMKRGLFTGKSYANYLNSAHPDYVNARRIINGTDRAALIAGYALKFEAALVAAV